ncbi:MAG TPA: alcohol dehydrogenase catalytic domain-containing protein [Atribacteraceae bacterium]|nr:alcohol dehydrogenase catalytic domain-containing protein [Atribacteraceae bacterium]
MKALVQGSKHKESLQLREVPEPTPGAMELKVRVEAAGVCGTDVHGIASLEPPVILGHEFSGVVVERGEEVVGFEVGDRVSSETTVYHCGRCPYCLGGHFNLCPDRKGLGSRADGVFAEYVIIPQHTAHRLPDTLSYEEGALLEPFACAVHGAVEQAAIRAGQTVCVLGPGPLGILVGWLAARQGAGVVLVGKSEDRMRMEVALRGGIGHLVNSDEVELKQFVNETFGDYGVDAVFECSGALGAVYAGLAVLKKRGLFLQMGILHRPVELDFDRFLFASELIISGSRTQKKSSWDKAIAILSADRFPLQTLVTHRLSLEEWQEGFALTLNRQAIKVILRP